MRSLELTLSRRRVLAGATGLSFAAAAAGLWSHVGAAPRITITEGNMQPLPIALPDFVGGALPDPAMARGVTQIITSNLQRSGLFAPIDQAAYIEKITNIDQVAKFEADQRAGAGDRHSWRASRTAGSAPTSGSGTCSRPSISTGKEYSTPPDNWRRIAHLISDAIYERLTGEKGYFDTRVVFVDESGPKTRAVNASRSWTRTAPTSASSPAATTSCSRRASRRRAR